MCLGKDMIQESICEAVSEVLGAHCKITDRELVGVAKTLVPSSSVIQHQK